ncbi:hypothetical protein BSKO_00323 [Bryopsis sp. KO-2023]|nr:hypothetical protein BSKO_00323 [Bryopsis sp. KO-2023]
MPVSLEYFQQRVLKRHASKFQIWTLSVSVVISGVFFGWNYGLQYGFWNMLIAVMATTFLYFGLTLCIIELACLSRQTGGAYVFARMAMGPWGGYLAGLAENMEYALAGATVAVGLGAMAREVYPDVSEPLCWAVLFLLFGGFGLLGVELSFGVLLAFLAVALTTLAVFFGSAISHLDFEQWALNKSGDDAAIGVYGVLAAMPYAMWFYLGLESVPLATEEVVDPGKDIPPGGILGVLTVASLVFATLFINASVDPGSEGLAAAAAPLTTALEPIWGKGLCLTIFTLLGSTGLLTTLQGILYAFQRQMYSLARAGYFPRGLSKTARNKAPYVAIIASGVVGWLLSFTIHTLGEESRAAAILVNMTLFGALISYMMQLVSYIVIRFRSPDADRSFKSPMGVWGAGAVLILVVITFCSLFLDPKNRFAMLGVAIWYAVGVAYFFFHSRHHLLEEDLSAYIAVAKTPVDGKDETNGNIVNPESDAAPLL